MLPPLPRRRAAVALTAALLLLGGVAPALASTSDDASGQVIDPYQQQGTGQVVLDAGHADFGPTFGTGEWALQIHDDTSTPRFWRSPNDVVIQVSDAALLTVPDDDAFSFLGIPAGQSAHVIPQVEQTGVVWMGWNTQEPTLLDSLNLGTTLRIHQIDGPGDVVTYVQSGNFGEPQVLWSSSDPFPQEAWIEVNTHTHANWVFSKPGVYLIDAEFTGELITGDTMSARGTLRFAVGSETDPSDAFAAVLPEAAAEQAGDSHDAAAESGQAGGESTDAGATGGSSTVWILLAGGASALVIAVLVVTVTSARARRGRRATSTSAGGDA